MWDFLFKKKWGCGCLTFGVGNFSAAIISFMMWKSIGWMILHGLFGWLYVIYWLIVYKIF